MAKRQPPKKALDLMSQIREQEAKIAAERAAREEARAHGVGVTSPDTPPTPPLPSVGMPSADPTAVLGVALPRQRMVAATDTGVPAQFPFRLPLYLDALPCSWSIIHGIRNAVAYETRDGTARDLLSAFAANEVPQGAPSKEAADYIVPGKLTRSSDGLLHRRDENVEFLSALVFDIDSFDVEQVATAVAALGVFTFWFNSFGAGSPAPKKHLRRGRLIMFPSRPIQPREFKTVWRAIVDDLLPGAVDQVAGALSTHHGAFFCDAAALTMGTHIHRRGMFDGGALDVDALLRERPQRPAPTHPPQTRHIEIGPEQKARLIDQVRDLGLTGFADGYDEWSTAMPAVMRSFPHDLEFAIDLIDALSQTAADYVGRDEVARKFYTFKIDRLGPDLDILLRRGREYCERIVRHSVNPPLGDKVVPIDHNNSAAVAAAVSALGPQSPLVAQSTVDPRSLAAGIHHKKPLPETHKRSSEDIVEASVRYLAKWASSNEWSSFTKNEAVAPIAEALDEVRREAGHRVPIALLWPGYPREGYDAIEQAYLGQAKGSLYARGDQLLAVENDILIPIIEVHDLEFDLDRYVRLERRKKADSGSFTTRVEAFNFSNTNPSIGPIPSTLKQILKRVPQKLPQCVATTTSPLLARHRDGTLELVNHNGYHAGTRVFFELNGAMRNVTLPDQISRNNVIVAIEDIKRVLCDFNFKEDRDRAGALLCLFLAIQRPALVSAPAIGISSHGAGQGSGKSTLSWALASIADGIADPRDRSVINIGAKFEEQEKRLHAALLENRRVNMIDNLNLGMRFDTSALAMMITSPNYEGRGVFGKRLTKVGTNTLWILNGNALNASGDMSSRMLLLRLTPRKMGSNGLPVPYEKNILMHINEHRAEIVRAALLLLCWFNQLRADPEVKKIVAEVRKAKADDRFDLEGLDFLRDATIVLSQFVFGKSEDPYLAFETALATSSVHTMRANTLLRLRDLFAKVRDDKRKNTPPGTAEASAVRLKDVLVHGDDERSLVGVMQLKEWSSELGGQWLASNLVDAPVDGLVLRKKKDRTGVSWWWIEPT